MNNEAAQKLQRGGAEREARAFDFECTRADDHDYENCGKCARMRKKLVAALEKCAAEARLEALEQAACEIDKCNQEGPYQAIAGAERIRALKAAQHGEKELRKAQ